MAILGSKQTMPDIIPFDEALRRSHGKSRAVLLGNGFSIKYFSYKTLLETTGLKAGEPLKELFSALDTFDFEAVMRALEDAAIVETAYGNKGQSATFSKDAARLRDELVRAVRATHPAYRADIGKIIPSCVEFLKPFAAIFTLNYDLLLYWVILEETRAFQDGFGLGKEESGFLGPFKPEALCNVYNLHGGLHLFKTATGEVEKRLMGASGVIDAIADTITKGKRLPIYVAEGKSVAKVAKINSVPYLKHCYETLSSSTGMFFVYGHSASNADAHIYHALFKSKIDHLYFCIHRPTADLRLIDGELARYKKLSGSAVDYTFVDSDSAQVWTKPVVKKGAP
jgi:hypothetical protein